MQNLIISNDLEAIRAIEQAASKGPWTCEGDKMHGIMKIDSLRRVVGPEFFDSDGNDYCEVCEDIRHIGNAEFIAHARQDIPALCDEVESLRERLKALEVKEPKWTTEKPTKDGWYWYRYFGEANIAEIKIVDGKPMAGDSGWKQDFAPECDFSTQIPEPTKGDQP